MNLPKTLEEADRYLEWRIYMFEQSLNRQMILLKYGPTYIQDLLDEAIKELSIDKIIGL